MAELVVVESPGKIRKISSILGSRYRVEASLGHVRDLPSPPPRGSRSSPGSSASKSAPVDALAISLDGNWVPVWEVPSSKKKQVARLRQADSGKTVWLAMDPDREGEAIAWHLRDLLGGSPSRFRRVTFSEITPAAVKAAFDAPRVLDEDLVEAQLARRFLDRLVGFKVSPLLSRRLRSALSAGRVQSAALAVLARRDEEQRVFVAVPFYGVDAVLRFEGLDEEVRLQLLGPDGKSLARFDDVASARAFAAALRAAPLTLDSVQASSSQQRPKPPFTTSTLQQAASSRLSMSPADTMAAAQKLYEAGAITYMRSDAVFLAPEAVQAAREFLTAAFGPAAVPETPPSYAAKEGAQEAHEAVRPTNPAAGPDDLGLADAHAHLYDLIRRRLLASQMCPATLRTVTWRISGTGPVGPALLLARGRVVVEPGWHAVLPPPSSSDDPQQLPEVPEGSLWQPGQFAVDVPESWTKPPGRFTEASLVAELESAGVGRPSTYAQILRVLSDRGYVLHDGRLLVVTPLGRLVADRLARFFPVCCDVGYTRQMEEYLDGIARGQAQKKALLDSFWAGLGKQIEAASGDASFQPAKPLPVSGLVCGTCGKEAAVLLARGELVVACRSWDCEPSLLAWAPKRASRRKKARESAEQADAEQAAADQRGAGRCGVCRGAVQRWKCAGGYVTLCQNWPRCAWGEFSAGRGGAKRKSARKTSPSGRARKSARTSRRR